MTTTETPPTLTAKQRAILEYIREGMQPTSPTVRQIMRAFGFKSPNGVTTHLRALERKGLITRQPGVPRNLRINSEVLP